MSRIRKRRRLGTALLGLGGLPAGASGPVPSIGPGQRPMRARGGGGRLGRAMRSSSTDKTGTPPPGAKKPKAKSGKKKAESRAKASNGRSGPVAAKRPAGRSKASAGTTGQRPAMKSGARAKRAVRSAGKTKTSKK